jgi:hypothetical protein
MGGALVNRRRTNAGVAMVEDSEDDANLFPLVLRREV